MNFDRGELAHRAQPLPIACGAPDADLRSDPTQVAVWENDIGHMEAVIGKRQLENLGESIAPVRQHPSRPQRALPKDSCDCHAHIFGPFDRYPLPQGHGARAQLAPFSVYADALRRVGFDRAVLVQPSAYGQDCRALLDALATAPHRLRAVAVKDRSVTDAELAVLHERGVRGLRFNELVAPGSAITPAELASMAPRLRERGWHAQIYATCDQIAKRLPAWLSYGVPLVFDHLARVGPSARSVDDRAFQVVLGALREGSIWIKLTAYRNGLNPPSFDDVRVFHDAFIAANPDRLLWGSDWPFLSMSKNPPDLGHLLDVLGDWVCDDAVRHKILVANPAALYGFDEPA